MAVRCSVLLSFAAFALTACAGSPGPGASIALDATDAAVRRVVVAPLNLTVRIPAELRGKGAPVWHQLLGHFQALDKQVSVISPDSAAQLWQEATLDLDLTDRSRALETGRSRFARALAEHRSYDLLVVPSLVLRPARIRGLYASWDGVRRVVPGGSVMVDSRRTEIHPATGNMPATGLNGKVGAASLHVVVLRPDGTVVSEGLGGLDVIQQVDRDERRTGSWTYEMRPDPFGDPENLREGVERVFETALRKSARRS